MSQQNKLLSALVNRMSGITPVNSITGVSATTSEDPPVDDKLRTAWNNYLSYLDKKGVRGKPELDKGGKGYALFDEYVKLNPTSPLNRKTLPLIRQEMLNYRNSVLNERKKKVQQYGSAADIIPGVSDDQFMKYLVENEKTADPNFPGQFFTSTRFPSEIEKIKLVNPLTKDTTLLSVKNKGFATPPKK